MWRLVRSGTILILLPLVYAPAFSYILELKSKKHKTIQTSGQYVALR